jgi:uncharacterized protein YutE (UPF0331/DUF86 family)
MTNAELVARKLAFLDEHLRRLRERRPPLVETFERDPLLQDATALGLLVVVQETLDIALHISADEQWELAGSSRETFGVLAKHGVIDAPLAASLADTVQLRNRIAHGYASVDARRLWTELPDGIVAFSAFARAIAAYLRR